MKFWENAKLSDGLSIAAFVLSLISLYVTSLRVTDDVRVVAGDMPFAEPDFGKKMLGFRPERARFVFTNDGMRAAMITEITMSIAQPQDKSDLPNSGCGGGLRVHIVKYDLEPFVLKPGDMIAKDTSLVKTTQSGKRTSSVTKDDYVALVPFSEVNSRSKKVRFRTCIDVSYSTPSVEVGSKTINEFEDELDESVMGYLVYAPERIEERRPVQLISRNGIRFFD